MDFGQRLRRFRTGKDLLLKELAAKSGVSLQSISAYESGRRKPGKTALEGLARALGISVSELLGETDTPVSSPERQFLAFAEQIGMDDPVLQVSWWNVLSMAHQRQVDPEQLGRVLQQFVSAPPRIQQAIDLILTELDGRTE